MISPLTNMDAADIHSTGTTIYLEMLFNILHIFRVYSPASPCIDFSEVNRLFQNNFDLSYRSECIIYIEYSCNNIHELILTRSIIQFLNRSNTLTFSIFTLFGLSASSFLSYLSHFSTVVRSALIQVVAMTD